MSELITPPHIVWTTVKFDRLVRDGVFDSMVALGQRPFPANGHLPDNRVSGYFERKLEEELVEYQDSISYGQRIDEAADFLAAWDSFERYLSKSGNTINTNHARVLGRLSVMLIRHRINHVTVRVAQDMKREKLGEFDKLRYVDELSIRNDDEWHGYYAANPKRFPIVRTWQEVV